MLALLLAALAFQPATEPPPPPARPGVEAPPPARPGAPAPRAAPRAPAPTPALPPPLPRDRDRLVGDWPADPAGKRVTLSDTVSLDDALEKIADAAGWNLVLNTGRTGNIQLVLKLRDAGRGRPARALSGTPSRRPAPRHGRRRARDGTRAAAHDRGFDKPSGKRFTGEFEETDVDDALRQIAAAGTSPS
jgi:hypothetical protein